MNHSVILGFVVLLVALVVALDASHALKTIERLAHSEGYIDIQSVMTLTDGPPDIRRPSSWEEALLSRAICYAGFPNFVCLKPDSTKEL